MNNLATTYSRLDRHNDAEKLQVRVLDAQKQLLGEQHPDTLIPMNNLALTYSSLGRWDDAEELFRTAIATAERTLGEHHPYTQRFWINYQEMQNKQQSQS
ncbi:unnamed protein product [Rhizoctonia solani]|uniref:Kinesin light chain n=1 Tax=Rhizoctonia solani TaxID=456999 RepID=A0A8H3HD80_9AGAM|nr:unnamed protein product [Rhizoctonia solani]